MNSNTDSRTPKLGEVLVAQGAITGKELALALSRQLGIPCVDLNTCVIEPEALRLIPESVAKECCAIPLCITNGTANALKVAMADPNDILKLDTLQLYAKMRITLVVAPAEDIIEAIVRSYRSYAEIEKQFAGDGESKTSAKVKITDNSITKAPAVRALDLLVEEALKSRASDIHIETEENQVRVRVRIDGVLHQIVSFPLSAHDQILSRLKVLSNMDIGDHRPQDGQFSFEANGRQVDVRVATIPTAYGEMGTLRLLDKSFALRKLTELGFSPDNLIKYEQMLASPFGMILISGPTGSGKTTTLYASLNGLDRKTRKIITVEDPIEYHLQGINQIQVNPRAKLTFSSGLRSIMRHDPDVILVGEIRDADTAAIAVQAANTGHLVLASVHANDTVGVLLRLIDLGVEPFLVASALIGIVAQRMVRRVCPYCQHEVAVPQAEAQAYYEEIGEERTKFTYGTGCNRCAGTGYLGRVAVFECLFMSEAIARLVASGANAQQIRAKAKEEGVVSMRQDGMLKVKAGITTPTDILQNVFSIR
jgi:general secretion pathway protein E